MDDTPDQPSLFDQPSSAPLPPPGACPTCGRPYPEFDRPGPSPRNAPRHGIDTINRATQKHKVLALIAAHPEGLTSHDCDQLLAWPDNRSAKRMTELQKDGAVYHTSETRTTTPPERAWVWRITPAGRTRLAYLATLGPQ